jgi:hypothetical protein
MRKITDAVIDPPHAGTLVGVARRPRRRSAPRDAFMELLRARVPISVETFLHIDMPGPPELCGGIEHPMRCP